MQQNIYDHPIFFSQYQALRDSDTGLNGVLEQPALRGALPPLVGADVLDLGCGFGDFARWARGEGAASVTAVDLSERMLEQARARTQDSAIQYRRVAIEDYQPPADAYDLAVSSLALHYVANYAAVAARVFAALRPGGVFALTVEHPICTASPQGLGAGRGGRAITLDAGRVFPARRAHKPLVRRRRDQAAPHGGELCGRLAGRRLPTASPGRAAPDPQTLAYRDGLRPHARRPALLLLVARKPAR